MSMIKRWMAGTIFLTLICLPCLAQDAPRFSVSGGYTYWRFDTRPLGFSGSTGLNGGKFTGTFNLTPRIGFVVMGDGGWGSHVKVYDGLAGARYYYPKGSFRFFGEGLFGKAKSKTDIPTINGNTVTSSLAYGVGGGVDYDLTPHFAVRAEAQYLRTSLFNLKQNNLQVSTGIVYHWGRVKAHKPKKLPKP